MSGPDAFFFYFVKFFIGNNVFRSFPTTYDISTIQTYLKRLRGVQSIILNTQYDTKMKYDASKAPNITSHAHFIL